MPRLTFINLTEESLKPFRIQFANTQGVDFIKGNITEYMDQYDCIVSPANSYGIMDGGIDKAISYYFPNVRENVKKVIDSRFHGEQPVGTSVLVDTGPTVRNGPSKILAHTPTMRIPKNLANSENAYLAFKALLCEIKRYNKLSEESFNKKITIRSQNYPKINSVLCTSFCNGSGDMPINRSAIQMKLAYKHVMEEAPIEAIWPTVHNRDRDIEETKYKK